MCWAITGNVVALTPHLQLLDRGGTEGIPAASMTLSYRRPGKLLLASLPMVVGLPTPFTPTIRSRRASAGVNHQRQLDLWPAFSPMSRLSRRRAPGILELFAIRMLHQPFDDTGGGIHAEIGGQQLSPALQTARRRSFLPRNRPKKPEPIFSRVRTRLRLRRAKKPSRCGLS